MKLATGIAMLPDGRMVAVVRKQYAHFPGEYKPLTVCWSDDQGKTWTKPVATRPHLMNISPTLATLDHGVVALQYGRPGFHVAFSLDDEQTWQDRVRFSHLPPPIITSQFDMVKVGPHQLVAVSSKKMAPECGSWKLSVCGSRGHRCRWAGTS